MQNLDVNDFMQVISVLLASLVGVASTFINTKTNGSLNKKGFILLGLFGITAIVGIASTLGNSIKQSNQYENLFDSVLSNLKTTGSNLNISITSLDKIENIQKSAQDITDSLGLDLKIQKDLTKSSTEILEKTRVQFNNIQSEKLMLLSKNEMSLNNSVEQLVSIFNIIAYSFTSQVYDSTKKINVLNSIVLDMLRILRNENINPLVFRSSKLSKIWFEFEAELRNIQIHLSGYNPPNIQETLNKLRMVTSNFLFAKIFWYKENNNNSFIIK